MKLSADCSVTKVNLLQTRWSQACSWTLSAALSQSPSVCLSLTSSFQRPLVKSGKNIQCQEDNPSIFVAKLRLGLMESKLDLSVCAHFCPIRGDLSPTALECNSWAPRVKIPLIFSIRELKITYKPLQRDVRWATRLLIDGTCFCWRHQSALFQLLL